MIKFKQRICMPLLHHLITSEPRLAPGNEVLEISAQVNTANRCENQSETNPGNYGYSALARTAVLLPAASSRSPKKIEMWKIPYKK